MQVVSFHKMSLRLQSFSIPYVCLSLAYVGSLKVTEKVAEGIRHSKTVAAQHSWFCTNSATVLVGLPVWARRLLLMRGSRSPQGGERLTKVTSMTILRGL